VVPTLGVRLTVSRTDGGPVQCILLTVVASIAAARRAYDAGTQDRLVALLGERKYWDTTSRALVWNRPTVVVPAFTDRTVITVPLPCSTDFDLATTKYLHAVREGDVTLELLLRGTVFYVVENGRLCTGQLPWQHEATARFPVRVWRDLVERYYGKTRVVRLRQDSFDRLAEYKSRQAFLSWDDAVDALMLRAGEGDQPWTG
jgi:hypothetical protein